MTGNIMVTNWMVEGKLTTDQGKEALLPIVGLPKNISPPPAQPLDTLTLELMVMTGTGTASTCVPALCFLLHIRDHIGSPSDKSLPGGDGGGPLLSDQQLRQVRMVPQTVPDTNKCLSIVDSVKRETNKKFLRGSRGCLQAGSNSKRLLQWQSPFNI